MQVYRALGAKAAASGPPNDPLFRLQPAASDTRLARLLIQRAAAHRAALRDVEKDLRREIIECLPMRRS